jgi:hypothetical protein
VATVRLADVIFGGTYSKNYLFSNQHCFIEKVEEETSELAISILRRSRFAGTQDTKRRNGVGQQNYLIKN